MMADYLASRIQKGALDYVAVTRLYPQFKLEINESLIENGFEHLIVE